MTPILICTFLSILSLSVAQDRAHGLPNEPPVAISPEAYTFFHPDGLQPTSSTKPCDSSNCTTLPLAASLQSNKTPTNTSGLGSGAIAGLSLGFLFVCLIGMGVYHVMIRRRSNLQRANPEQQMETA